MCKYLPKLHLHTESHQDRFRNKKVFSCVPLLLWKSAGSNGVCKMSHFEAGSRNFTARKLIFGYFVVQLILSKSYYWHFSIRPFICMRDGLKDAESVPPYCGPLYMLMEIIWGICRTLPFYSSCPTSLIISSEASPLFFDTPLTFFSQDQ